MKESIENDKPYLAETKEEQIEDTVLVTTEHTGECKHGFNNNVKKSLMIENAALGWWISWDEDLQAVMMKLQTTSMSKHN